MNLDFNEICRFCLRFCEKYVDLNQTNGVKTVSKELAEKIKFCYLLPLDLSQGLPTKVCYECIQVISFFYLARKNVYISEQLLRDVLYVRQKLKDEAKIHKEENITGSGVIKLKPEKQKNSQSLLATSGKTCNVTRNIQYTDSCESNSTSDVEYRKNSTVSHNPAQVITINFKQHHNFRVEKKKKFQNLPTYSNQNKLGKSYNVPKHKSGISSKQMDLKKIRNQPKRHSKAFKVDTTEKETNTPLDEYVFKEIGTVIDTSNILSPDVKRARKSVLGS